MEILIVGSIEIEPVRDAAGGYRADFSAQHQP